MTLPYSRAIYAELVLDLTVHSLLSSLRDSCLFFQGTARQWLFDKPKTVVISRAGDLVKYHAVYVVPLILGLPKFQTHD